MNPFEKKLVEMSDKTVNSQDDVIKDAKLLLESNAQEEIATLRSIGLDAEINYVESKRKELIIRSEHGRKLEKQIVSREEIRKLCLDYRLYMLPANEYKGKIPPDLGAKLTRYCKEKNIALPANSSYSRFFIIAPPFMFKGYMPPRIVLADAFDISTRDYKRKIQEVIATLADPILVFQTDDHGKYFGIIESWGNDFTPLRRIYGFFTKRKNLKTMMSVCTLLITLWILKSIPGAFSSIYHAGDGVKDAEGLFVFFGLVASIGIFIAAMIWQFNGWFKGVRRSIVNIVTRRED